MENKEYYLKYRGFRIVGEKNESIQKYNAQSLKYENVGGVNVVVYKAKDKQHKNPVYCGQFIFGHRISAYDKRSFVKAARRFIDDYYVALAA